MMNSVYLEDRVLPKVGEYDAASASSLAKGSFLLRRACYFNDIWHEKIISQNLRAALVENIAMLYLNRGVALSDLIKEGNLGLTHALENFEFEGGARFSSYAARCIRQNIERFIIGKPGAGITDDASEITSSPILADSRTHRKGVSSRGAKARHQCI